MNCMDDTGMNLFISPRGGKNGKYYNTITLHFRNKSLNDFI